MVPGCQAGVMVTGAIEPWCLESDQLEIRRLEGRSSCEDSGCKVRG